MTQDRHANSARVHRDAAQGAATQQGGLPCKERQRSDAPDELGRAAIAARIPHHGDMCLLDRVTSWSETSIHCVAHSQQWPAHPLRAGKRLGIANGIEYAAQAMAVHGALTAGQDTAPRAGYLTSVREVEFHAERLDAHPTLDIHAERLSGDGNAMIYRFSLSAAGSLLLAGRASVMLDAAQA